MRGPQHPSVGLVLGGGGVLGAAWLAGTLDAIARETGWDPGGADHVGTLGERLALAMRQTSGRRLKAEADQVQASGTEVILMQPTVHDLDAMGSNLMSHSRHRVLATAVQTVTEQLRESPNLR